MQVATRRGARSCVSAHLKVAAVVVKLLRHDQVSAIDRQRLALLLLLRLRLLLRGCGGHAGINMAAANMAGAGAVALEDLLDTPQLQQYAAAFLRAEFDNVEWLLSMTPEEWDEMLDTIEKCGSAAGRQPRAHVSHSGSRISRAESRSRTE
jgi:hypothetical protein